MRSHRVILAELLKAKIGSHRAIAKELGWSPAKVGHVLSGRNEFQPGELERMCELAGITYITLASQSDDMVPTKRPRVLRGAALLEGMTDQELEAMIALMEANRSARNDS